MRAMQPQEVGAACTLYGDAGFSEVLRRDSEGRFRRRWTEFARGTADRAVTGNVGLVGFDSSDLSIA
jgi:hypothetical protein